MKNLLRPSFIAIFLGILLGGGFLYFSSSLSGAEVYSSKTPSSISDKAWRAALSSINIGEVTSDTIPAESLENPPNLTDAVAKSLAASLGPRILEEGGLESVPLSEIQAAAGYLPKADALLPDPVVINPSELTISEKNDASSVKKYFEKVFSVYKKTFYTIPESDILIIERVYTTGNYAELAKLEPIVKAFDDSISEVKKIPVPRGWEDFTIRELGYLSRSSQIISKIKNSESDPIAALIIIPERIKIMEEIDKFSEEIGNRLKNAGIIFSPSEEAYQLFY